MEICKGFTCEDWQELEKRIAECDESAWTIAIEVFKNRMSERFFRCIDQLRKSDASTNTVEPIVPGFSIMALCCVVAETLQSFYVGGLRQKVPEQDDVCRYPNVGKCLKEPSTARAFRDFFAQSPHFSSDFHNSEIRGDFAQNVRNALLHEAETRSGWLIRSSDPVDRIIREIPGGYVLNRTRFYEALLTEFNDYLERLSHPSSTLCRLNFLARMRKLCSEEPDIE